MSRDGRQVTEDSRFLATFRSQRQSNENRTAPRSGATSAALLASTCARGSPPVTSTHAREQYQRIVTIVWFASPCRTRV